VVVLGTPPQFFPSFPFTIVTTYELLHPESQNAMNKSDTATTIVKTHCINLTFRFSYWGLPPLTPLVPLLAESSPVGDSKSVNVT